MAVPRRTDAQPSTARRQAIEAAVLAATEDLLAEGAPYAELNVERIATRAGISRTAFYFYFRHKRELLMRLTADVTALLYAEAEAWWSGEGDGATQLERALRQVGAVYRDHGALLRAVVEVATYDEEVGRFWHGLVGRFAEATQTRIEAEQTAGRALAGPAGATAFALVWMTERSYYQLLVSDDAPGDDALLEALAAVWVRTVYGA